MKKLFILGVLCLLCSISAISQSKKEWERAQSLNSWNVYQQFIINYPDGKYTELAKQKLAQLKEPELVKKVKPENKTGKEPIEKTNTIVPDIKLQTADQIIIKKGRYYLNDKKLKNKDLKELLKGDPESAKEYKKSQSAFVNSIVALIAVDGVLVATTGYILGVIPGMLITVPFSMSSAKHQNEAIKIYNSKHISGSNAGI